MKRSVGIKQSDIGLPSAAMLKSLMRQEEMFQGFFSHVALHLDYSWYIPQPLSTKELIEQFTPSSAILRPLRDGNKELIEQLTSSFAIPRPLIDAIEAYEETVGELKKDEEYLRFPFLMCGEATVSLSNKAVRLWKRGKKEEVYLLYYRLTCDEEFQEEICKKLEKDALFAKRMKVIRDALEAHRNGKYSLSIPALYPVIDGILIEKFEAEFRCAMEKEKCSECGGKRYLNAYKISKKLEKDFREEYLELAGALSFMKKTYHPERSHILHGLKLDYHENRELSTLLVMSLCSTEYVISRYDKMKAGQVLNS